MIDTRQKEFIGEIEAASKRRFVADTFGDAVHMMACSIESPLSLRHREIEDDYKATASRYDKDELSHIAKAFGICINALERERCEFLGGVLEEIGASAKCNGQFLTPRSVAALMARILATGVKRGEDGIVRLCDPACGASVLLIEQAEELVRNHGVPQRDIYIEAGDIDRRACDISFVELSLLGYSACVRHRDELAMKDYSPPRFTPGFHFHRMAARLGKASKSMATN